MTNLFISSYFFSKNFNSFLSWLLFFLLIEGNHLIAPSSICQWSFQQASYYFLLLKPFTFHQFSVLPWNTIYSCWALVFHIYVTSTLGRLGMPPCLPLGPLMGDLLFPLYQIYFQLLDIVPEIVWPVFFFSSNIGHVSNKSGNMVKQKYS